MTVLKKIWETYKEMILYIFFGGCTTLVNMAAYALCYYPLGVSNLASTLIAWALGVAFAFVTNKLWVFESKSMQRAVLLRELVSFVGCRAATGLLDVAIMYVCVDLLGWNGLLMKALSNIVVIILNFIASKLVIFTKKK